MFLCMFPCVCVCACVCACVCVCVLVKLVVIQQYRPRRHVCVCVCVSVCSCIGRSLVQNIPQKKRSGVSRGKWHDRFVCVLQLRQCVAV